MICRKRLRLRCVYGSIPSDQAPRCRKQAAVGFDYCEEHGERISALYLAAAGEQDAMRREHIQRLATTRRKA